MPGVGEKTALKLLKEFETVENVLESIDQVSGKKLKEKLEDNRESAIMSKKLATIYCEAPLEVSVEDVKYDGFESSKVVSLFKELGFNSLLAKFGESAEEEADFEELTFEIAREVHDDMLTSEAALIVEGMKKTTITISCSVLESATKMATILLIKIQLFHLLNLKHG